MFRTISDFLKGEYEHGEEICHRNATMALDEGDLDEFFYWKKLAIRYGEEAQNFKG